uniref:Uncharacterized protein n=1 Tax=Meloidogyne javanica TaxID=6303 RepID=A0A915LG18_MELJA
MPNASNVLNSAQISYKFGNLAIPEEENACEGDNRGALAEEISHEKKNHLLELLEYEDKDIAPEFFMLLNKICIKNAKGERNYIKTAAILLDEIKRKDKLTGTLIKSKEILKHFDSIIEGFENKKEKDDFKKKFEQTPLLLDQFDNRFANNDLAQRDDLVN